MNDEFKRELEEYGIVVEDGFVLDFDENKKIPLLNYISRLEKKTIYHKKLLKNLIEEAVEILYTPKSKDVVVGEDEIDLFVFNLKDTVSLFNNVLIDCDLLGLDKNKAYKSIKVLLNKDYKDFSLEAIRGFPDYKISIDWTIRELCSFSYIQDLLKVINKKDLDESSLIKEASGIQGPWANLDLPMKERAYEFNSIEEQLRVRDKDIRNQRRYEKGFRNYNNDGRVGEGHYWREIRNEPYSWMNRKHEDPYPGRNLLKDVP